MYFVSKTKSIVYDKRKCSDLVADPGFGEGASASIVSTKMTCSLVPAHVHNVCSPLSVVKGSTNRGPPMTSPGSALLVNSNMVHVSLLESWIRPVG